MLWECGVWWDGRAPGVPKGPDLLHPSLSSWLTPHRALPLVWAPHFLEMGLFGGSRVWTCILGHSGVCSNIKRQLVTTERLWGESWQPFRAVTALGPCHPSPSVSAGNRQESTDSVRLRKLLKSMFKQQILNYHCPRAGLRSSLL